MGPWTSRNTDQLGSPSHMGVARSALNTTVTSKITDHRSLQQKRSLKYYEYYHKMTEMQSEQMLLEKWCQETCVMQDCHIPL